MSEITTRLSRGALRPWCLALAFATAGSGGAWAGPLEACAAARERAAEIADGEPGLAIAVLDRGRLACAITAGGLQARPAAQPVTRNDRFYIASLAKPLLAALAVDATLRGKLDLDGSIRTWIPELPESYQPVTLRLLLKHQGGVPDIVDDLPEKARPDNAEVLRRLLHRRVQPDSPGAAWSYSNTGYVLVAIALERATGTPIQSLLRRQFRRLGMKDASSLYPRERVVLGYARKENGWEETEILRRTVGPGGVHASLDDMIAALRALRAGTLIPPPFLTEATAPTLTESGAPSPFSLGLQVEDSRRGLFHVASFGSLGGYRHALVWFPDRDQGYLFLSARDDIEPTGLIAPLLGDR